MKETNSKTHARWVALIVMLAIGFTAASMPVSAGLPKPPKPKPKESATKPAPVPDSVGRAIDQAGAKAHPTHAPNYQHQITSPAQGASVMGSVSPPNGRAAISKSEALQLGSKGKDKPASANKDNISEIQARELAKSPASRDGLAMDLAQQEVGVTIAGKGSKKDVPFRDSDKTALAAGGKPSDWVKKSSDAHTLSDGRRFQMHWEENIITGERRAFKQKSVD